MSKKNRPTKFDTLSTQVPGIRRPANDGMVLPGRRYIGNQKIDEGENKPGGNGEGDEPDFGQPTSRLRDDD